MKTTEPTLRIPFFAMFLILATVMPASVAQAGGALPVTGLNRPQLAAVDTLMTNFMDANGIRGGVLGIMRNGVVVYQRGFGFHDEAETIAMPENALVRVASCTKPVTAAAIRMLIADGNFLANDNIFNVGQPGGGVLNVAPFPALGSIQLPLVSIQHCLIHQGGWDRSIAGDLTRVECTVASDMGIQSPPGRANTLNWVLGQPLQFSPGSQTQYSNEGYLALGQVVFQESGMSYINFVRSRVLTPNMWVPWTDIRVGQSFPENQPLRETWYDSTTNRVCKYQRDGIPACDTNTVEEAYGGRDFEARTALGALVVSAATLLRLAETYNIATFSANIGQPLGGVRINGNKNGGNDGVNTFLQQRTDGVNFFVFFNQNSGGTNFGNQFAGQLNNLLNSQASWPTVPIDGFWVHPDLGFQGLYGSYNRPYDQLTEALPQLGDGSIVNFWPGVSTWTGTINKKLLLRAPIGIARIGG